MSIMEWFHSVCCLRILRILGYLDQDISPSICKWPTPFFCSFMLSTRETGNCICSVFVHSGGHTAYAKSARQYLDQMKQLPNPMDNTLYERHQIWLIDHQKGPQILVQRVYKPNNWAGSDAHVALKDVWHMAWASRPVLRNRPCLPNTVLLCESLELFRLFTYLLPAYWSLCHHKCTSCQAFPGFPWVTLPAFAFCI